MRTKNSDLLIYDNENLGPIDMSISFNLQPIWLANIAQYAIQVVFTGSPAGNFKLQASNDTGQPNGVTEPIQDDQVVNWTDIADSAATVSAAGNVMWNVENVGYNWVRVVWTHTSGGGELTVARIMAKGV